LFDVAQGVRRDQVHQRGRQTVVRLEPELPEARAHGAHFVGLGAAALDDRRDERGELPSGPAPIFPTAHVHEVEAVERVALVLDAGLAPL